LIPLALVDETGVGGQDAFTPRQCALQAALVDRGVRVRYTVAVDGRVVPLALVHGAIGKADAHMPASLALHELAAKARAIG